MNSDSESLQRHLLSLLLEEDAEFEEKAKSKCEDADGVYNPISSATYYINGEEESGNMPHNLQLGEIPTVQERFQTVLKRRLQIQIQNRPPLFPWETQLVDYPDYVESPSLALVPAWGWSAQQVKLNLPIPLPENIFGQLLEKCQAMVASSLPLGAKLVQVVESFFPNESQALNDLAGMVLRSPYRSTEVITPVIEGNYSDLRPRQQMALSLLAAKELLENLTLTVSSTNPLVERQWLTSAGVMTLKVNYQKQSNGYKLRIEADLPVPGVLKLQGNSSETKGRSAKTGTTCVELYSNLNYQPCTLDVEFPELGQQPLRFFITPTA